VSLIWQPCCVPDSRTTAATGRPAAGRPAAAGSPATARPAASLPGRPCSVAAGLALVGDKWSLLIVRELIFNNHRFDQLARNTGAPRDRLAARLGALTEAGVIERVPYNEHPPRFEYHLTESGRDLIPVIGALRTWGDKWAVDQPPVVIRHTCGHPLDAVPICRTCGEELKPRTLTVEVNAPGWDLHGPVPTQ